MHTPTIPCDDCRDPQPPDRVLPFSGRVLCALCCDDAVRRLRQAEQLIAEREASSRTRAA